MKELFAPQPNSFNPEGYPREYLETFKSTDAREVAKFMEHVQSEGLTVERVMTEITEKGAEVWRQQQAGEYVVSTGINWADPTKFPRDYFEYARTFWDFNGPVDTQLHRGDLLAAALNVSHVIVDKRIPNVEPVKPTLLNKVITIFHK